MSEQHLTLEQYKQAMIIHAKRVQGENYLGDEYYMQECWDEHWAEGTAPEDAVEVDMTYFD